ncbi:MAG TPA: hypothetical protein PKL31_16840 [Fulvivirga sp.]|nr:hypothetical protein [Fulvivirga sp.]
MNEFNHIYKGEVYDKKSKFNISFNLFIATAILSLLIFYAFMHFEDNDTPNYLGIIIIIFCITPIGILRLISTYNIYIKPVNYTSKIKIVDDGVFLLDKQLSFSEIKKVTLRIRNINFENLMSENNHLEIETTFEKFELGLIINNQHELEELELCVDRLKKIGVNLFYKNYLEK